MLIKSRVGLAGLVLICFLPPRAYRAAVPANSQLQDGTLVRATTDALDAYLRGAAIDAGAVLAAQGRQTVALASVRPELERTMERWINQGAWSEQPRRTLVAVALVVDLLDHEWRALRWDIVLRGRDGRLVERPPALLLRWCMRVLSRSPSRGEVHWWRVAIAQAHAASDLVVAERLGRAAYARFPNDPGVAFALASLCERRTYPDARGRPVEARSSAEAQESARLLPVCQSQFAQVARHDEFRDEATLHLAFLDWRLSRRASGLERLAAVTARTNDPFLLYLAAVLHGEILRGQGQFAQAATQYLRALEAVPGQTAATLLASLQFLEGHADTAAVTGRDALASAGSSPDPWRLYGLGEIRRRAGLMAELRRAWQ